MFYMPIVWFFFQDNGLNQIEYKLLVAVSSISVVLMEVPSGYVSDVIGRRNSLLIGVILNFLGFVTLSMGYTFYVFLIAQIFIGVGQSFISGSDSALLYDSLLAMRREKDYMKYEGITTGIGHFSESIAGLITAFFLIQYGLRAPYIAQAIIAFIAIPAAFMLKEPPMSKPSESGNQWKAILTGYWALFKGNKTVQALIWYSGVMGLASLSMAWDIQPLFERNGLNWQEVALLWSGLNFTVGIFAFSANWIEKNVSRAIIMISMCLLISVSFLLIGKLDFYWALIVLFGFYAVRGFTHPLLKKYINDNTPSNVRAGILSIRSFIIRFAYFFIGPALGYVSGKFSVNTAFELAGFLFITLSILLIVNLKMIGYLKK